MEEMCADLVVIGSGPSGQKGAVQAAKLGKKVIVLEKDPYPGGACLNSGTIPSKSLREAILDLTDYYKRGFSDKSAMPKEVTINDLNDRLNRVLTEQRQIIKRQFSKNQIEVIYGMATFVSPQEVEVADDSGKVVCRITGDFFLIATGSKPRNPGEVPFDNERVLDSTRLLSIDHVPQSMTVLGGGIIGSE